MSAFLGFIHHLMWQKINFTNSLAEEVIKDFENVESAREEIDALGTLETGELSEIIDTFNIHGWLADRVELVEERLAKAVEMYLKDKDIESLKVKFFEKGKSENFKGSKSEAYALVSSKFLDGMPCDGSITVLSDEDDVEFVVYKDVHADIWNKYAGVETYWTLRDEFVRGVLNGKYTLEKRDNIYSIRG
ncbi:hypothetical protein SAMN00017477_0848 [Peptoniphilus asaccharolyticus DSM 20463]|uniref:Uncharacterized protein n=1 Tax=Peptoniphilus asaccharolyticus DSM 20463 TaxID=573058 RepID=A0A1W1UYH3_PEPAS|nr:hypothetical protein [Peptoniphilus asaccharolyticus]MBL7575345.1 hypothetical protein [Peptoniphilus asaccharolyticus]SMB86020.1 hypothetical protein SAMN00017477_0848 [Peptoniphilus asaccharolyticus DSM 20463]